MAVLGAVDSSAITCLNMSKLTMFLNLNLNHGDYAGSELPKGWLTILCPSMLILGFSDSWLQPKPDQWLQETILEY